MEQSRTLVYVSFFLTLVVSLVIFFINLGGEAYWDYDEAAYAQVISEMNQTGDFLTMHYGGEVWVDKPPLYFWVADISRRILGDNEFATRIPAALSAVFIILFVWLVIFQQTKNAIISFLSAAVLFTTGAFVEVGRQVRLDTSVTLAILGTWYFFIKGEKKSHYYIGVGICIGIGLMIKNLVAFLAVIPILLYSIVSKDVVWLKNKYIWIGTLIGCAIALPWPLYEIHVVGTEFISRYIGVHIIQRFTTNLFHNDSSVVDYVGYLYMFATPWIEFFIIAVLIVFIFWRKKMIKEIWYLFFTSALSAIIIFFLFALAQTKAETYLTPIYPFIGITLGIFVYSFVSAKNYYVLLLMIIATFPVAIFAGFHIDPYFTYDRNIAEEEKTIGTLLRTTKLPVYFTEDSYWETIRVYSEHNKLDLNTGKLPPYYVIVQNRSIAEKKVAIPENSFPVYVGKMITLYFVSK